MAPLTWRNVDAPNFSGTAQSLQVASALLGNATSGLNEGIDRLRSNQRRDASGSLMLDALKYTDADAFANALRSGTVGAGMQGRDLTPEALQFLANREAGLIANQGARLRNDGQGINNATSQFNLDEGRAASARGQGYRDNQPAANEIMTQARALMESGEIDKIAQGRKMMADNSRLFTAAGMDANAVAGYMAGNTAAAEGGMTFNQNAAANQDFFDERYRQQGQKGLLAAIVADPSIVDSAGALKRLRETKGVDPKTLESLTKDITEKADVYFPKPDVLDTLTPVPTNQKSPTQIVNESARGGPSRLAAATPRFAAAMDRTEGGGDYDTLFGHAQRKGGNRFAGVSVSNMTVGQAIDFSKNSGYGEYVRDELAKSGQRARIATPMGRHQIVGSTLAGAAKEMGLDPNTRFDRDTQDAVAMHIAKKAISGPRTMTGKIEALRGQWEGFKNLSNAELEGIVNELDGNPNLPVSSATGGTASSILRDATVSAGGVPTTIPGDNTSNIINNITQGRNDSPVFVAPTAVDNTAAAPVSEQVSSSSEDMSKFTATTTDSGAPAYRDANGTLFQSDGQGNYIQIDKSGVPNGSGDFTPVGAQPKAPAVQQAAAALSPSQVIQNAQTVNNSGIIDSLSNDLAPVEQQLIDRPYRGQDTAAVVRSLRGTKDAPGALSNVPESAITEAINQIMKRTGMPADVAAVLAQNSTEGRDLGGWFGTSFMSGDRFGGPTEGRSGTRINIDKAVSLADNFRNAGSDKAGNVAPGTGRLNTAQNQAQAQAQVQVLSQQVAVVQERVLRTAAALQQNPNNPELRNALEQAQAQLEILNARLSAVSGSGNLTPYTGANITQ